VVENGLMLCPECHSAKTAHTLLVKPEWLSDAQVSWLATNGYAWWDSGEVYGARRRIFQRMESM
jgi:hypothetical protein